MATVHGLGGASSTGGVNDESVRGGASVHKPGMTILHYKLFHGQQTARVTLPCWPSFFGDHRDRPLRIMRNHASPNSQSLLTRQQLGHLHACARTPWENCPLSNTGAVRFPELIDFEVPALGDMSWENNPALGQAAESEEWPRWPDNLFEYLPQVRRNCASPWEATTRW